MWGQNGTIFDILGPLNAPNRGGGEVELRRSYNAIVIGDEATVHRDRLTLGSRRRLAMAGKRGHFAELRNMSLRKLS